MITKVFWIIATLEFLVFSVMIFMVFSNRWRSGPEGPVGGFLLLIPPIAMLIMAGFVFFSKTEAAAQSCVILLSLQLVPIIVGPIYSKIQEFIASKKIAGDDSFRGAQRALAHAILAGDLVQVQEKLLLAGDLNKRYGDGETVLRFAVMNVGSGSTIEIVKAMLDAGANPNLSAASNSWPLEMAIYSGPALVEILLKAGADPNLLDTAERPLWWNSLQHKEDGDLPLLRLFLDHGADLGKRHSESGPVGWAAHSKNWPAVWLLMQRGAEWKNESQFGVSLQYMVDQELESIKGYKREIPAEMRLIVEKLKGG